MSHKKLFERVAQSFRQGLMRTLGARLFRVEPGICEISLPYSEGIAQQTQQQGGFKGGMGFMGFHTGAVGSIADSAARYAALTATPDDMEVVCVEYKINFLANFQVQMHCSLLQTTDIQTYACILLLYV
jgi:acyl-coenzyme A thioesterase PaaI-like protein